MSENPQVKAILEHIETRERELADQAGQFRVRIEELSLQLGELDAESENLRITRKTLLALPLPSPATGPDRPDIPDHPAYQQILTALTDAGRPMRARDLCQALDPPEEHRRHPLQTETLGQPGHSHRTRTRPVRPPRRLTAIPHPRPAGLPQPQPRNGEELTFRTLRCGCGLGVVQTRRALRQVARAGRRQHGRASPDCPTANQPRTARPRGHRGAPNGSPSLGLARVNRSVYDEGDRSVSRRRGG